jgi:hypothetical protein
MTDSNSRLRHRLTASLVLSLLFATAGCSAGPKTGAVKSRPVVRAVFSNVAPKVDGRDEAVWKKAPAAAIKIIKTGEIVQVKALYTKTRIYVKAYYPDKTHDFIDRPWVFDGTSWKQRGQQDSLCFIWNINDSIRGFNERGFSILTQGLEQNRHPWEILVNGGSARAAPAWFKKQLGDFWSTGLQLPYGKAEDWVLKPNQSTWANGDWNIQLINQHDQYPNVAPWVLNKAPDWSQPIWRLRDGLTIKEDPYPVRTDMVDIAGYKPQPGEVQPFIIYSSRQARWGGSKDDIDGAESWSRGFWTVEMGRPLNTGHADDIQFAPEKRTVYTFGLLVRRGGSQYEPTGPVSFEFEPQK